MNLRIIIRYNRAQKTTRNMIERTFGIWKRRFPCLNHLRLKLKTSLPLLSCIIFAGKFPFKLNFKLNLPDPNDLLKGPDRIYFKMIFTKKRTIMTLIQPHLLLSEDASHDRKLSDSILLINLITEHSATLYLM